MYNRGLSAPKKYIMEKGRNMKLILTARVKMATSKLSDEERRIALQRLSELSPHKIINRYNMDTSPLYSDKSDIVNPEDIFSNKTVSAFPRTDTEFYSHATVSVVHLISLQDFIPRKGIEHYINDLRTDELPYVVELPDGRLLIASGTTRLAAQVLAGRKSVEVMLSVLVNGKQKKPKR